jgi:hypothetical protein
MHSSACDTTALANQTFLITGNDTVLHIYQGSQVLTWTSLFETQALFGPEAPPGEVILVEAGEGIFEGAVRFRNPVTDFCLSNRYAYGRLDPCELEDPEQVSERFAVSRVETLICSFVVLFPSAP